jgi:hypothetical protein
VNITHTINMRKAKWIGHRLRMNYVLKHVAERKRGGGKRIYIYMYIG